MNGLIRRARWQGAITQEEASVLYAMVTESDPASATKAFMLEKGAPDRLYAALYFTTLIWQSNAAKGDQVKSSAGFKLAQHIIAQEYPGDDPRWSEQLFREFFEAHEETARQGARNAAAADQ